MSDNGLVIARSECSAATDDPAATVAACAVLPDEGEDLAAALFGEAPNRVVLNERCLEAIVGW